MEGEVKGKTYKMKGHTLPGINQRSDANATNVAEQGLAGSSVFQQGMMGQASNMVQPVQPVQQVQPTTMAPPIMSKPSMAKIYANGKRKKNPSKY